LVLQAANENLQIIHKHNAAFNNKLSKLIMRELLDYAAIRCNIILQGTSEVTLTE